MCKPHCGGYGQVRVRVCKQVSRTCPGPGALSVSAAAGLTSKSHRWMGRLRRLWRNELGPGVLCSGRRGCGVPAAVLCAFFTGLARLWSAVYTSAPDTAWRTLLTALLAPIGMVRLAGLRLLVPRVSAYCLAVPAAGIEETRDLGLDCGRCCLAKRCQLSSPDTEMGLYRVRSRNEDGEVALQVAA